MYTPPLWKHVSFLYECAMSLLFQCTVLRGMDQGEALTQTIQTVWAKCSFKPSNKIMIELELRHEFIFPCGWRLFSVWANMDRIDPICRESRTKPMLMCWNFWELDQPLEPNQSKPLEYSSVHLVLNCGSIEVEISCLQNIQILWIFVKRLDRTYV